MPVKRSKQLSLFKAPTKEYGGALHLKRKGRRGPRPLSAKQTIHLTLRSTKAIGARSFKRNHHIIAGILKKQAQKAQIKLIHWANSGNHLHLHIKLPNHIFHRREYNKFIRAVSGLIARKSLKAEKSAKKIVDSKDRFWDLRPYTRILMSWREYLNISNYINLNQLEAMGHERVLAREMIRPAIVFSSD